MFIKCMVLNRMEIRATDLQAMMVFGWGHGRLIKTIKA
jgi:hypothetical protein